MDSQSVINLGHTAEQPLMCSRSELADGFEPHGYIYLQDDTRGCTAGLMLTVGAGGVYPG